jgi:hypothetical protein
MRPIATQAPRQAGKRAAGDRRMSCGSRIRVVSEPAAAPSHAQALMACDAALLRSVANAVAAGEQLTPAQASALRRADELLTDAPAAAKTMTRPAAGARLASAIADSVAVAQRDLLTAAVVTTLQAENWTVTVVAGSAPDRFTGIEASCGTGHLVVAVGAAELLADQACAHGSSAVIDLLVEGLREVGWAAAVDDSSPCDQCRVSLYALSGEPTRAHAVETSLRWPPTGGQHEQGAAPAEPGSVGG